LSLECHNFLSIRSERPCPCTDTRRAIKWSFADVAEGPRLLRQSTNTGEKGRGFGSAASQGGNFPGGRASLDSRISAYHALIVGALIEAAASEIAVRQHGSASPQAPVLGATRCSRAAANPAVSWRAVTPARRAKPALAGAGMHEEGGECSVQAGPRPCSATGCYRAWWN
jgi:hypothetical protein